jgi:hypothetical protein
VAENCILMQGIFFIDYGRRHASRLKLAVRNGIKSQLCKRNEKTGRKWLKNMLRRHQEI